MAVPPTPLVTCPYDEAHIVEAPRLAFHLAKCSKLPRASGKVRPLVCPFNSVHHIPPDQMEAHLSRCENRDRFDTYCFQINDAQPAVALPVVPNIEAEETWDDEGPSYDPQANLENREGQVMQVMRGAQPAERRRFRMQQRHTFTKEK